MDCFMRNSRTKFVDRKVIVIDLTQGRKVAAILATDDASQLNASVTFYRRAAYSQKITEYFALFRL